MKFSKQTGCFYPDDVHYDEFPDDIISVPEADFASAMSRQSGDMLDVIDGRVVVVPLPPPTAAEIAAAQLASAQQQLTSLTKQASERIAPLADAVELDMANTTETAALKAWKKYRVELNRVPQQAGYPAAIDWPTMPT